MDDSINKLDTQEEDFCDDNYIDGSIITQQKDPEIDSLFKRYKRGRLILQPTFQRDFVWDTPKSSRLIESALLDIPIPTIYLAEEDNGKELVIDGQQRLTSFFSFIDGSFPDGRPFKLSGLKKFESLVGKSFAQLPERLQDQISCYQVRTITIKKESSKDLKFEIFERLNTASVGLNDQELRNCIYRGKYNDLLIRMAYNADFQKLLGFLEPHKRMKDVEYVLRFAAFYHSSYLTYKSSMRSFLNREMEQYREIGDSDAKELENAFKQAVSSARSIFGDYAFRRFYTGNTKNPNGHWEKKKGFNTALFDVLMFSFTLTEKRKIYPKIDLIREALFHLMTSDREFVEAISSHTNNPRRLKSRFGKWVKVFDEIIDSPIEIKRCFSRKIKEELYKKSSECTICGQKIVDIDDAHVDHIIQYWKGGETIPENARLTHRFCNQSRRRLEED